MQPRNPREGAHTPLRLTAGAAWCAADADEGERQMRGQREGAREGARHAGHHDPLGSQPDEGDNFVLPSLTEMGNLDAAGYAEEH